MTASSQKTQASNGPTFPAENDEDWRRLMEAGESVAFVRTNEDWRKLLAETRGTDRDPLRGCDDEAVNAFSEGLIFRDGGLAGADYEPIAETLSFAAFRALFERFGIGLGLFADHDGYRCESRGTCTIAHNKICTSNC